MARAMTMKAASKEAIRRWGRKAMVHCNKATPIGGLPRDPNRPNGFRWWRCSVGRLALGLFFEVLGEGDTFESAFADADERARRDHERYLAAKLKATGGAS